MSKKVNKIIAEVKEGIFKGKNFKIKLGRFPHDCHVYCNGKELKNVQSILIYSNVGRLSEVLIEMVME